MASEEDVLLREVDEDLSRDQTFERLRKYRVPLIGGAVLILAGVTGWQFYSSAQERAARQAAEAYAPLSFAAEGEVPAARLAAFAQETESGYRVLASLRAAAQLGEEGDLEAARDLYAAVFTDASVSAPLRDLARVKAGYLLFDNRPAQASEIVSLVETEAFRAHAEEIVSAAALSAGDYAAARAGFQALAQSASAPAPVKSRAETFLLVADAAANGAALEAPESARSFIERFGADLKASGIDVEPTELPPLPGLGSLPLTGAADEDQPPAETAPDEPGPEEPQ